MNFQAEKDSFEWCTRIPRRAERNVEFDVRNAIEEKKRSSSSKAPHVCFLAVQEEQKKSERYCTRFHSLSLARSLALSLSSDNQQKERRRSANVSSSSFFSRPHRSISIHLLFRPDYFQHRSACLKLKRKASDNPRARCARATEARRKETSADSELVAFFWQVNCTR